MERQKDIVSLKRRIEKYIITAFCAAIAIGVIYVLLFVYEPDKNTLGALGSVCMDVICIFVLITFVVSLTYEREKISRTARFFLLLMLGTVYALFFDFLNWAFDGMLSYAGWTYLFTLLSLCMGSVLAGMFVLYLCSYMNDMYEDMKAPILTTKIFIVCDIISFALTLTLALTKHAFDFVDGHYVTGELYDYIMAIPVLTLIYMTIYAIVHVKIMGIYDVLAVVGYIFTMICGAVIEAIYNIGATYVSVAIADIFIFLVLQNKSVERLIKKSNTDEFTGFLNRNAYEDAVAILENTKLKDNFVYVSIDINSLKIVNDSLGHDAGDELIIGACQCIKQCFGSYGRLYRTGGDEFVALIYADETELEQIKRDIEELTDKWSGRLNTNMAISCGYVTRREAKELSIHQMSVLADKRMYESKARYYQTNGIERRGVLDFGSIGRVHPDDIKEYLEKTGPEYISNYFKENSEPLNLSFRRKNDKEYLNIQMEISAAKDYSDECQKLILSVKEVK